MSYIVWNGPAPTTAAQASVAVAAAAKTMLQLATPSDMQIRIDGWGYSIDVAPGGIGIVELLQTDVAATVTAHVSSGVINYDPGGSATRLTLGTSATGYTGSAEGSITATRVFATKEVPVAAGSTDLTKDFVYPYQSGPLVAVSKFLRIRTTFTSTTPKMVCYVVFTQV